MHDYLTRNLDEIQSIKMDHYGVCTMAAGGTNGRSLGLPDNINIHLHTTSAAERDGKVTFDIPLYAKGQTSRIDEEFWTIRQNFVNEYEQERRV